jgi:hypothetical protein
MATKLSTSRLSGEIRAGVLFGGGGGDLEAPVEGGSNFNGIQKNPTPNFVDGKIAVRHPLIECALAGGRLRIGE